jgi:hypothetical protein
MNSQPVLSPSLTGDNAKADNHELITVEAQVTLDGEPLSGQNVTFELSRQESDTFIDDKRPTWWTQGETDLQGKISKSFRSWAVGEGQVYVYVTRERDDASPSLTYHFHEWLPDADSRANLELIDNDAQSDGVDAIKAKVTLNASDGVTPLSGVKVNFELLYVDGRATFEDTGEDNTSDYTDKDGTVEKAFVDSYADTGAVHAFINTKGTGKIYPSNDYASFTFKAPQPDHVHITLDNDGAVAGSGVITATARVWNSQGNMKGQLVHFELTENNAAVFTSPGTDPKHTEGTTDDKGEVTVAFTDSIWEEGTINAWVDLPGGSVDDDEKFTFVMPSSLKVDVKPLEVQPPGQETWIEGDNAPADGVAAIQVTAKVTCDAGSDHDVPMKNVEVVFELPETGHAVFGTVNAGDTSHKVYGTTDQNGCVSKTFTCDYIESAETPVASRTVRAYVAGPDGQKEDSRPFTFSDPWQDVTSMIVSCGGGSTGAIYKNGQHQAAYHASFKVASAYGETLKKSNQPTIDNIIKRITLIDYDTKNSLALDSLSKITYSLHANEYDKQIVLSSGPLRDEDNDGNQINDSGLVTITWYITCGTEYTGEQLRVGLKIEPSGTDKTIYYAVGTDTERPLSPPVTLRFMPAINYDISDLHVSGEMKRHDGQSVNDDSLPDGSDTSDGNYWRQWDYRLVIQNNEESRRIFKCCLAEGSNLTQDYAFSEKANGVYDNTLYFWPNNVRDAQGTPLATSNHYTLYANGIPKRDTRASEYNNDGTTLYFTLYSTFGNINYGGYDYHQVNFSLYDQYGNFGEFSLAPENIPKEYNSSTMGSVPFIRSGFSIAKDEKNAGSTNSTVLIQSVTRGQVVGMCKDDYINKVFGGTALELLSGAARFTLTCTGHIGSGQPVYFDISTKSLSGEQNYISQQSDGNGLIFNKDDKEKITWLIQPVWNNNHLVISKRDAPASSWYPADAFSDKTGQHLLVYVHDYSEADNDYKWLVQL